jgi:hypothetical protein
MRQTDRQHEAHANAGSAKRCDTAGIASRSTFRRRESAGLPVPRVGRLRFIYPADLNRFIAEQSAGAPASRTESKE